MIDVKQLALVATAAVVASWGCGDDTNGASSSTGAGGDGAGTTVASVSVGTTCPVCGDVRDTATIADPEIVEASGIAVSVAHPGAVYVENDSGDTARFFAVGAQGESLGTFDVTGATAHDWEDMDRGPCPDGSACLFLADIGDNSTSRTDYTVYRTPEPARLTRGNHPVTAEAFSFAYPDGSHNAEAMLVHPITGAVTIVTKAAGGSDAYDLAVPLVTGKVATKVGPVSAPMLSLVTGGSVRPDGKAVLLRTYGAVLYYAVPDGVSIGAALAAEPCQLPAPAEQQGEAIAFTTDGAGYVTVSEGAHQHLFAVDCHGP